MTQPLLALCVRPQIEAARAEYMSFLRGGGWTQQELHHHNLVTDPLPADALERYSGFVVGGSPFNVSDPASSKSEEQLRIERELETLAGAAIDGETSLLLTCYGIGVATRLLGGRVSTEWSEDASPSTVRLTDAAATDPLARTLAPTFQALTAHKEGSGEVPPGATLLATNDDCPVQMYRAGLSLWATQFHPEPSVNDFTWRMAVYRDAGYFDPSDYDRLAGAIEAAKIDQPTRLLRNIASLSLQTA